jgi:hypothetical protein
MAMQTSWRILVRRGHIALVFMALFYMLSGATESAAEWVNIRVRIMPFPILVTLDDLSSSGE